MYIQLTTHSAFSLQEGLSSPTDLVQAAQANGMPAIGLTDHNLLTGMIEFVTAGKAAGIQPIVGLEINLNDGPVSLFATSLEGWSCLCKLSSSINLRDNADAPCTLAMLASCSNGLIAISKQPHLLKEIFPDRLYVNIQDPNGADNPSNLARQLGLPTVITHPIYYLAPEQASLQRTLTAVRLGKTIATFPKDAAMPPDGRESWRPAFLELSLFIVAAVLLVMLTYFGGMNAGWQRDPEFLGKVIMALTLPFLLLGLTLGLPRWAYPFGGLLLMMLAFAVLAAAEVLTNPRRSILPLPLRRIGQSISVHWTRLSFGVFGAMPLVILLAFDDAYLNSRTPYLALSALAMVICALFYCRSRDKSLQVTVLLAGLTCAIFGAWLDRFYFAGGLMNWVAVPSTGIKELLWLFRLWLQWGLLMVSPAVLALMGRAASIRAARKVTSSGIQVRHPSKLIPWVLPGVHRIAIRYRGNQARISDQPR